MNEKETTDIAYGWGEAARRGGKLRNSNPYPLNSELWYAWNKGWDNVNDKMWSDVNRW